MPPVNKDGYEIEEWTNKLGEPVGKPGEEYTPTGNETLKPQWIPNTYTVAFNGNGADSGSMSDVEMIYDQSINLPVNM